LIKVFTAGFQVDSSKKRPDALAPPYDARFA
jgi:hypothetical protein